MYYNHHAKAKELIKSNHLVSWEIVENWNGIKPADNHRSMPIRQYKWDEYKELIWGVYGKIINKRYTGRKVWYVCKTAHNIIKVVSTSKWHGKP